MHWLSRTVGFIGIYNALEKSTVKKSIDFFTALLFVERLIDGIVTVHSLTDGGEVVMIGQTD